MPHAPDQARGPLAPSRSRGIRRRGIAAAVALCLGAAVPLVAQSPQGETGTLVVLNKGESTATFIDVASGEILRTLPTGEGPHELAMTGDGRWAVSTDYAGGKTASRSSTWRRCPSYARST